MYERGATAGPYTGTVPDGTTLHCLSQSGHRSRSKRKKVAFVYPTPARTLRSRHVWLTKKVQTENSRTELSPKRTHQKFQKFATFVRITAKTYGPPLSASRSAQPFGHDRTHGAHAHAYFSSLYDQAAEWHIVADGESDSPHPGRPPQLHFSDRRRGTHLPRRSDSALSERRRLHRSGRTILCTESASSAFIFVNSYFIVF